MEKKKQTAKSQCSRKWSSTTLAHTADLLEAEQVLEVVLEGKVERLGGKVAQHVGEVTTPQRVEALLGNDAAGRRR
jgi:hypothetical protein